ncbi:MAG TPA: TetR/AcrR family transcriptional regulator [Caulobacteraceae bacterium]
MQNTMNSRPVFSSSPEPVAAALPKGVRAAGKARSRQSLLDAAKRLFMQRGYEGATVREIAAAAGLSTGAVFASFSDKSDLFNEVLLADLEQQAVLMREAAGAGGPVGERLKRVLDVGFQWQLQQLELLRAAVAVSWSQGLSGDLGDRPVRAAVIEQLREALGAGVDGGELKPETDVELVAETLWDCYIRSYRRALYESWGFDQLSARLGRQIDLLLAGQRA